TPTPVPPLLVLTSVDDHFAPSTESLDFVYNIRGLAGRTVKLRILADNYAGKTCFERDLTGAEKADGNGKPMNWDGKCNQGARNDRFATPLMGPYKVQLFADDSLKSELPFKILYASIELSFGKHTPDGNPPPEDQREKFVQAKLDELGYDSGPVDGVVGDITRNALRRFQRANYKSGTTDLLHVTGAIDDDTVEALKAATARETFEDGKDPLTDDCKFYVYDNFMNDPTMNFVTGSMPEFNSLDRKTHAEDKMEQPYIALEVEVKLQNKANSEVSAPDAVGNVPIAWEMDDATEDASVITNPTAANYVQHAREIGVTGTIAGAARIDGDGDNALNTFDGFRRSRAADYVQMMFPQGSLDKLEPYTVDHYDTENRGGTDFHRAIVKAYDDATANPHSRGHAGIYFRFSMKGGDDAKVRAALTFKGLPNEAQLTTDHSGAADQLFQETGRWTVWRRTRISAYCTQVDAPPRPSGLPDFVKIAGRWNEAFIEVENGGSPITTLTYTTVVTQDVYNNTITGMPASHRPAGASNAANLNYSATCIYGGPAVAQHPGETAAHFVTRAERAMSAWCVNPINAILKVVHDAARQTSPEGFVIFDFRLHDAITGQDPQPGGGFAPSADPSVQNQIASTAGYVRCAGAVTMNVDNNFNVNCYLCHECGHGRFLYHHITTDQTNPGVSDNPTHHDRDQPRCIMSYGIGADTPDGWDYPFCGKCLLRLRGWKVTTLPRHYV
ncbi:MAG TPA: peptidoglycan-binding domain-containing protein, partial [Bryobacteraceae bacterium]